MKHKKKSQDAGVNQEPVDDNHFEDSFNSNSEGEENYVQRPTLEEYNAGLLDYDGVYIHQYERWGQHRIVPAERETLRFLAATYGSQGRSLQAAQVQLDYTKTFQGLTQLLPKTIGACWNVVRQVSDILCCSCYVHEINIKTSLKNA